MDNIILIGMPACGKSTVGVILAKTLGKAFLDTDLLIQEREGELLQNLIDKRGMESFIKTEEAAIKSINADNTVIATGGSVIYSDAAMKHLVRLGIIVYLKLSFEAVEDRLHNIHTRGIAIGPGETLKDLYDKRTPFYEKYQDIIIDTEGFNAEQTVEQIIDRIGQQAPPRF